MELVLFLNCYAEQIKYYLDLLLCIRKKFNNIKLITTYENLYNASILNSFKTCDYIICSNIKNYEHLTVNNLKKMMKPSCKIIVFEFFRFNGFYPLKDIPHNNNLWIIDDSFLKSNNFDEYINYMIQPDIIKQNFNLSLKKLKNMSKNSDIKVYDFFISNYKTKLLYRDHWHMSHIFLLYIIKQILVLLDIKVESHIVDNIPEHYEYGFKFRYRPILNCVKDVLNLRFIDDNINFFNKVISKKQFYTTILCNRNSNLKIIENEIKKL